MSAPFALKSLDALPRTPASDLKKLGWRGVMKSVARHGKTVVTNHDEPEAVILPIAEYTALLEKLREATARDEAALDTLRRQFDQRLACLNAPGAGEALDTLFDKPFSFEGQPFTGNGF